MGAIANFYHSPEFKAAFGAGPADGPTVFPEFQRAFGGGAPLPPPPPPVLTPANAAPAVQSGGSTVMPLAPDGSDARKQSLLGS